MDMVFFAWFLKSGKIPAVGISLNSFFVTCPDCVCVLLSVHIRPWVLGPVSSPPPFSMVTFASIVEEEKQQQAALIRTREKPLALIQVTCRVCARWHSSTDVWKPQRQRPINPSGRRQCLLKMEGFRCCCDSSLCSVSWFVFFPHFTQF